MIAMRRHLLPCSLLHDTALSVRPSVRLVGEFALPGSVGPIALCLISISILSDDMDAG